MKVKNSPSSISQSLVMKVRAGVTVAVSVTSSEDSFGKVHECVVKFSGLNVSC